MVKMNLPASEKQSSSCSSACNSAMSGLQNVGSSVGAVTGLDIQGAAATSAKNYAERVAGQLVNQTAQLLQVIQHDVAELPARYKSMVDRNKSWSTEELNKKISECDEEIFKAECDAGKARVKMLNPMANHAALESYIRNAHKAKANARSKKRKYQKKLRNLDVFNSSSATIFANVHKLSVAVGKGASVVKGAKTFAIPHKDDLKWTKVKAKADTFHIVEPKEHTNCVEEFCKSVSKIGSCYHKLTKRFGRDFLKVSKGMDEFLNSTRFFEFEEGVKAVLEDRGLDQWVPAVGIAVIALSSYQDYEKRRSIGESPFEAAKRTFVSQVAQIAYSDAGGIEGALLLAPAGAAAGAGVTAPVDCVGALPGLGLGALAGVSVGSMYGQNVAIHKYNSDIGE